MASLDAPKIVSSRAKFADSHTLSRYLETGGYEGLRKALTMFPEQVAAEVDAASLLGREVGVRDGEPDAAAHPNERSVGRDLALAPARAQVVDERVEGLGGGRAHVAVVHLDDGCDVAVREALGLFEGEHPVGRGAPHRAAERGARVREQLLATGEQAGDVGADAHDVLADGLEVEHVVERRGPTNLGRRGAGELGDLSHGLVGDVTVLLLGQVQQGQHRRSLARVERHQLLGTLTKIGTKVGHRSTSPMMGSTVEMTVMASDIEPPRMSSGTACRFTKLGARTWIR